MRRNIPKHAGFTCDFLWRKVYSWKYSDFLNCKEIAARYGEEGMVKDFDPNLDIDSGDDDDMLKCNIVAIFSSCSATPHTLITTVIRHAAYFVATN